MEDQKELKQKQSQYTCMYYNMFANLVKKENLTLTLTLSSP